VAHIEELENLRRGLEDLQVLSRIILKLILKKIGYMNNINYIKMVLGRTLW
jgi:hypothetical protein